MEELKVKIIDTEAKYLHRALGITEERAKEIAKIAKIAAVANDGEWKMLEEMSEKMNHINELVFAIWHTVGDHYRSAGPLGGLLSMIRSHGEGE